MLKGRPAQAPDAQGYWLNLPASASAAATATVTTAAATAAAAAATETAAARPIGLGSGFIHSESPAAQLFAISGIDSCLHVLLGNLYEPESLVADDSDLGDRAVGLEHRPDLILAGMVGQIPYIK
jgi:hypothetical protein